MLFSSMEFLWLFLPVTFLVSRLLPQKRHSRLSGSNLWLLAVSLLFYAWGEPVYILLMLFSILFNYLLGGVMAPLGGKRRKAALIAALTVNLGLLGYFKYFDFFLALVSTAAGRTIAPLGVALPIGISFYTFQILSYIIDLYRGEIAPQKNPLNLALYISFFPQLIAGPIVSYRDIAEDLSGRAVTLSKTAYGIRRFIFGLAKKVLIANTVAVTADHIIALPLAEVPFYYLWYAYLCYALQIYFDFSGYSDMAVGLGSMFGFRFLENFNLPYLSGTVTEFWRRWHISLSAWFRNYLYIPLGGNRGGLFQTCRNLILVFFCTGLWHGAGWNFVVWGLWHGLFLIAERFWLKKKLESSRTGRFLGHVYTLAAVFFGWVFFRAGDLPAAFDTIARMFDPAAKGNPGFYFQSVSSVQALIAAAAGIALSGPLQRTFSKTAARLRDEQDTGYLQVALLGTLLAASVLSLAAGSYNPFIYFRF